MKILIIGGDSKIGKALKKAIPDAAATSRRKGAEILFDLEDPGFLPAADAVILCAGISKIKECDDDHELSWLVNVSTPLWLAKYYNPNPFIYLSTDLVHTDILYGRQKKAVEESIKAANPGAIILRMSRVVENEDDIDAWLAGNYEIYNVPVTMDTLVAVIKKCLKR